MTLQAAPIRTHAPTAPAFVPLVAAAGFTMSLTAPLEVLFAVRLGYGAALIAAFMLTSSLGVIVVDVLGTRVLPALDARRCLAAALGLFGLACIGMAVADWWPLMMIVRMLQGFGSGVLLGTGLQASARLNADDTALAISRYNTAFLLGGALGSPGGLLVAALVHGVAGDRLAFEATGVLALLLGSLALAVLPPLPAPHGTRAQVGLPRFDRVPGTVPALALAMVGDFLRGGVLFCALPLVGGARDYATLTIGVAIAVMSGAEIVMLGVIYRLVPRVGLTRILVASLALGLGCAVVLATSASVAAYLLVAAVFGCTLAGTTIALPLLVVAHVGDSGPGLARFRISAGIGMLAGSSGCAALGTAAGAAPLFWAVAAVLLGALALMTSARWGEPTHAVSPAAK